MWLTKYFVITICNQQRWTEIIKSLIEIAKMIVWLEKDGIKKSKFKVMFDKIESYELGI